MNVLMKPWHELKLWWLRTMLLQAEQDQRKAEVDAAYYSDAAAHIRLELFHQEHNCG